MIRPAAALLALALATGPAWAGGDTGPAAAAERLARAIERLSEAEGARDRVAALTETIAAYERGLAGLRDSLRDATLREAAITRRLEAESARVSRLLGVLTALERTEGPLLLLHPSGPLGTARSGMILADVTPALQAQVAALQADLGELSAIRSLREAAAGTLAAGLVQAQTARSALGQAIADRAPPPPPLTEDAAALAALARAVETLDAFAAGLAEYSPPPARADGGFAAARGALSWPVQGVILRPAGAADAAGIRRPGVVLATRPAALVTSPWSATVRYRGPVADYANVMVLEPEDGYLLVLAGLDVVYAAPGDVVEAGAPLGLMGGSDPSATEFLAAARQGGLEARETLYVEFRQGGVALDPQEWFGGDPSGGAQPD